MKKFLLLFLALIATTSVWAEDYITDVMVIGGSKSETNALKTTYTNQGWTVINQDLNAGASGDYIFLLYKKASETASGVSFITDFYISSVSGTAPDEIEHNGRTYHIAPCDGSDYFKSSKGDLNCHCSGSAYIHLYYTKEYPDNGQDYNTVKSISFNSTQAGSVGENGGTTGYDLNAGAGGDYIYMHIVKSQGWTITNSAGNQCYINGFDSPKAAITSITIPTMLGGAQVAGFTGSVFSGFTNLETMIFNENTIISQMPSMLGCSKFKHVRTGSVNDQTPPTMTNIPTSAFAGTAIETINMPSVTNIGEHAFEGSAIETITMPSVTNIGEHAFEGCGLNQITLPSCLMEIGSYAFQNCNSLTDIYFDGTQQQWGNVTKGTNWKPNATKEHWHCTMTFDANGHGTAPASQNIEWSNQDKATEPTAPTVFGFTFNGWYTEAACTNQWDFNMVVPGDMTLYSKWEETQYGFNSETGELALLWGEFNKGNKWGDDVPASSVKSVTANSGVSFTGDCSQLFQNFSNCTSMDLHNVNTSNATRMEFMFEDCNRLTSLNLSSWNTSNVTNMSDMFISCGNLSSLNLSGWDTGNVTDMSKMFEGCGNLTSLDLSGWDTGNVTNMSDMFNNCRNLSSLNLSGWNTSNVTNMSNMFEGCGDLTSLDLSGWDTGNVTNMSFMFLNCHSLTSLDLSGWDTGNVTDMSKMFEGCGNLTSLDLSGWDTGNVTDMSKMFSGCENLTSLDFSGWDTSNVTDMGGMFGNCMNLSSLNLSGWNTSNVTDMSFMFCACKSLTSLDLWSFNTGNVTGMYGMFGNCMNLSTIYASEMWSTEKVHYSDYMFNLCNSLVGGMGTSYDEDHIDKEYARIDGGPECPGYFTKSSFYSRYTYNSETGELKLNWGEFNKYNKWGDEVPAGSVKSVTANSGVSFTGDCSTMFYFFSNCESMDLSNVSTSNVTNMRSMFSFCQNLSMLDLTGWDTGNVTNMRSMFLSCNSLTSLDLSDWDTGNVTDMASMFIHCWNLSSLNLSGWDTGNVTDMAGMFANCILLSTIYASEMWSTESVVESHDMFYNCRSLVGGKGTTYDSSHIDAEYARIDGGPESPGYFTAAPQGVPGDVNGDGSVTSADVTCVYNYLLSGDDTFIDTCDVNGDGAVTSADVTVIYNILLGNKKK